MNDTAVALAPDNLPSVFSRAVIEHQVGNHAQGEVWLQRLVSLTRTGAIERGTPVRWLMEALAISICGYIKGSKERFDVAENACQPLCPGLHVSPFTLHG